MIAEKVKALCALLPILIVLALSGANRARTLDTKDEWSGVARLVAIGDVHGAYDELVEILQDTKLIDSQLRWIGGRAHLVQTGDFLDRGTSDKKVMDLLIALEEQAEKAGGKVHVLIGNHEAMNLIGDLRYVAKESYAAYAGPKSEETRERAYRDYLTYLRDRARKSNQPAPAPTEEFKQQWLAQHPPGYFEQRSALAPQGKYGRWLGARNAVVKINGIVFVHGGISETVSTSSVREINERIRQELTLFQQLRQKLAQAGVIKEHFRLDEIIAQVTSEVEMLKARKEPADSPARRELEYLLSIGSWHITHPAGPLWYRGYGTEPENSLQSAIEQILANLRAKHLVVGHTTSPKGIVSRWSGKVFLIDTGMLKAHYQGRCSALVIEKDTVTEVYPSGGPCAERRH
jgi:hypothetical protein